VRKLALSSRKHLPTESAMSVPATKHFGEFVSFRGSLALT
jgi:hypothetical protein